MTRDDFRNLYIANFGEPPEWKGAPAKVDPVLAVWYAWTDRISGDILRDTITGMTARPGHPPKLKEIKDAYGQRFSQKLGWHPTDGERCPHCENTRAILTVWVRDPDGRLAMVSPDRVISNHMAHVRAFPCRCAKKQPPDHAWKCRFEAGTSADRFAAQCRGEGYMEPGDLDADLAEYLERILACKVNRDEAKAVNRNAERFGPTLAAFAAQDEEKPF